MEYEHGFPRVETRTPGEEREARTELCAWFSCKKRLTAEALSDCMAPAPCPGLQQKGLPAAPGKAGHEGDTENTNTCFILFAKFFVGLSVKNTNSHPFQKEGPQGRGPWLLALSKVRGKVRGP